jgi:hypothetical protein
MRYATILLVLAGSFGCAAKAPLAPTGTESDPTPPAAQEVTSAPRVPMTVEWLHQGESSGRLTLVARVNRNAPLMVPTSVRVTVPAGVQMVSGRTSWVIPGSDSTGPVDEILEFDVGEARGGEILLTADAVGANFGVHAKKGYPLGGPSQKAVVAPSTPGPSLEVGGHDFGPSVPASP